MMYDPCKECRHRYSDTCFNCQYDSMARELSDIKRDQTHELSLSDIDELTKSITKWVLDNYENIIFGYDVVKNASILVPTDKILKFLNDNHLINTEAARRMTAESEAKSNDESGNTASGKADFI